MAGLVGNCQSYATFAMFAPNEIIAAAEEKRKSGTQEKTSRHRGGIN